MVPFKRRTPAPGFGPGAGAVFLRVAWLGAALAAAAECADEADAEAEGHGGGFGNRDDLEAVVERGGWEQDGAHIPDVERREVQSWD